VRADRQLAREFPGVSAVLDASLVSWRSPLDPLLSADAAATVLAEMPKSRQPAVDQPTSWICSYSPTMIGIGTTTSCAPTMLNRNGPTVGSGIHSSHKPKLWVGPRAWLAAEAADLESRVAV